MCSSWVFPVSNKLTHFDSKISLNQGLFALETTDDNRSVQTLDQALDLALLPYLPHKSENVQKCKLWIFCALGTEQKLSQKTVKSPDFLASKREIKVKNTW